jgi:Tfp pilus assembly protein PilF
MTSLPPKYNPSFIQEDELLKLFVARKPYLDLILQTVRRNDGPSNQNILVVGPRGIGKTTLVLRVAAEVRHDPALAERWYPIVFPEEAYDVSTSGEFWLETLGRLAEQTALARLQRAYEQLKQESDETRLRELTLAELLRFSEENHKRLLVIVENLNMLLGEQLSKHDAWVLRHTLLNESRIMLLATALSRFEAIDNVGQAWFELFEVYTLDPLNPSECEKLFHGMTGRHLSMGQARAIQILTGGNPRLIRILAEFTNRKSFHDLLSDLTHLVDNHTEYFKSQIDSLPSTERRVFVSLLDAWEPVEALQVAKRSRMTVSKASALLNRLISRGAVLSVAVNERKKLYQAAERLHNIYYLVRRHGQPSVRVRAAVRFMTYFYRRGDLIKSVTELAQEACKLDAASRVDHFAAYGEILSSPSTAGYRSAILRATPKEFFAFPELPEELRRLGQVQFLETGHTHTDPHLTKETTLLLAEGQELQEKGDIVNAENLFRRAVVLSPDSGHAIAHLGVLLYLSRKQFPEAAELLERATAKAPNDPWAWMHRGLLAHEMGEYKIAISALQRSVELRPNLDLAWRYLGHCYHDTGEYERCELALRKAIEFGGKSSATDAWSRLAELLHNHLNRPDEAEQAYLAAISIPNLKDGSLWWNYANFLESDRGRRTEAEVYFEKAHRYFESEVTKHPEDGDSWSKLARIYARKPEDRAKAEAAFRRAVESEPKRPILWEQLTDFLIVERRWQEAEEAYRSAVKANPNVYQLWTNFGFVLAVQKNLDAAEAALRRAVEINPQAFEALAELGEIKLVSGEAGEGMELLRRSADYGAYQSRAWPTLLAAQVMLGEISLADLHSKAEHYLNENARDPKLISDLARKLAQTRVKATFPFAERLAKEALAHRNEWTDVATASSMLVLQGRWQEALVLASGLFDAASEVGDAVEAAIDFSVVAASSGHAKDVLDLMTGSKGRASLEPLEVGLIEYLGHAPVAPKEIAEIAHDIAARIEAFNQQPALSSLVS